MTVNGGRQQQTTIQTAQEIDTKMSAINETISGKDGTIIHS